MVAVAAAPLPHAEDAAAGLCADAAAGGAAPVAERVFRVATGAKDGRVALWTLSVAQGPRG
jgi:hypothetical protein